MSGFVIGGMMHQNSSVVKDTHPNIILALGDLAMEFPWDPC